MTRDSHGVGANRGATSAACTCDPEAYESGPEGQKRYFPDRGCPVHGDPEWIAATSRRLVLTIEFPGFYVEDIDQDGDEFRYDSPEEQVEDSMHLASDDVVVVFSGHEGDSPGTVLRSLEGHIRKFEVRDV